ncbi:hypothetical protein HYALB_00013874 [Hymenoscyphus albidus]|uniref:Vacuolar ATPase assembly protein VMA22 n=1 Tax=Hymenoscyphus albidus TaxID=595503 RepID=A0A9N9Q638_9HELO|nr:hypothetical protein HYALB_00013874 [Hymenoscyphus albidus]
MLRPNPRPTSICHTLFEHCPKSNLAFITHRMTTRQSHAIKSNSITELGTKYISQQPILDSFPPTMPDFNSVNVSVRASSALADMNTNELSCLIDGLLEEYLELLDQYTNLRAELGKAQSSIQQHLARANFHADRGVRYGASFYTPRMQASRVCRVTSPALASESPTFSVHPYPQKSPDEGINDITTKTSSGTSPITSPENFKENLFEDEKEKEKEAGTNGKEKDKNKIPDPIRMFGFSTSRELKEAQKESISMIEGVIPKLLGLDEQMKGVEIEIRRARKYRAKAEAQISEDVKP